MNVKYTSLEKICLRGCEIGKHEVKALRKVLMEGVP